MSLWSCCSEASRSGGTAKSEIVENGLAFWMKYLEDKALIGGLGLVAARKSQSRISM